MLSRRSHPALTRSRSRVLAIALTLAMSAGLAACTSDDQPDGGPETSTAGLPVIDEEIRASVTQEELTASLAAVGIATYDEPSDSEPSVAPATAGRMSLTGWQVETMTRQLNAGRGYVGRDLDELTGGPVPISVVLAAWVSTADTPAAATARELMGERDWATDALDIVYPDAVLALFTNDIAADPAFPAPPGAGAGADPARLTSGSLVVQPALALPARAGICSDLVGFLGDSLDSIVQSLQVQVAEEGALSVLASIWNTVVSIAASAAQIAVGALTSALIAPVAQAITVVAVLSSAAALLNPWSVTTTVSPSSSIGPGVDAAVTADVATAVDFSWPADVTDCAATLAGVELPDPASAQGSEVTWGYEDPDLTTTRGEADEVVGSDNRATLRFATLPQGDQDGIPVTHPVVVKVDLKRTQVDKLMDLVSTIVLGGLPGPARAIVDALIGPLRAKAQAKLAELLSVAGPTTDIQTIRFEPNPDPVVEEPPAEDCAATAPTTVPDGTWQGPIDLKVTGKGLTGQAFSGGRGTMKLKVVDGKVVSGRWNVDWRSTGLGSEGGVQVALKLRGNVHGSVEGSAAKPSLPGQWAITGRAVISLGGTVLPLDFSGKTTETMRVEATSCDAVSGTFVPSFNANAGGGTTFSGTARWSGSRVG